MVEVGVGFIDVVGGCGGHVCANDGVGDGRIVVVVVFGGNVGCHHHHCDDIGGGAVRGDGKIVVVTKCFVDCYQYIGH